MLKTNWHLVFMLVVAGCGGSDSGVPGLTGPSDSIDAEFQIPVSGITFYSPFEISVSGANLDEVRYEVDGSVVAVDQDAPFEFTVDPSSFAAGSHLLTLVAMSGEESAQAQFRATFAEPPPVGEGANLDWADRAGASDVTMATNFNESRDVFDFARDPAEHYEWERTIRKSGDGALKILIKSSDGTSGWDWWRFLSDDMEPFGSAESGLRDEYYVSFSVYIPASYYNWIFKMDATPDKKFCIISQKDSIVVNPITRENLRFVGGLRNGSSVTNEIVLNDIGQEMWPMVYVKSRGRSAAAFTFIGKPSRYDFSLFNVVDEGVKTGTPKAYPDDPRDQATRDLVAQFGPHYAYGGSGWSSGLTQGALRSESPVPHPDPIAAGKSFRIGWNTVKMHVKFPTTWLGTDGLFELSMAHPGDSDWTKLVSVRGDDPSVPFLLSPPDEIENGVPYNNGVDGWYHVGIWLTPYRTAGQGEEGVRPDTFLIYDELIASTKDIPAPSSE